MLQPVRPSLVGKTEIDEDTRATLQEADSALARGDLVKAGTHYMAVARETPGNGDAWLGVSCVLLMAGEFDRATGLLDRTIAQQHKSKAWLALSHVLITKGEFDRAAEFIDRSIALQPNDAQAYSLQALIFRNTGHDQGELNSLVHAVECSPNDPQLWDALITAIERVSGPDAAIEFLERNRHAVPKNVAVDVRRAQLCVSAGHIEAAELRIRELLTADPDNPEAPGVQALLFLKTNRYEEALGSLERAIQHSPSNHRLWETLITVLQQLLGPDGTIEYLERNHDRVPEDTGIEVRRAQLCASAGRLAEAESRMRAICTANPHDAALKAMFTAFLLEQANAALGRGKLVEAGMHYMAAAREAPDSTEAWLGASRVLTLTGEFDSATELVDRTIPPAHKSRAWLELSRLLLTKSEFGRATELVVRAITLQPKDPEAHCLQALIFRNAGNDQAELAALKRASRYSPTDRKLWEQLISVLERVLGPKAAIDYLENNRDAMPKGVGLDLRKAQLCAAAGQFRKLDLIVRRVPSLLEANPDNISDHPIETDLMSAEGPFRIPPQPISNVSLDSRLAVPPKVAYPKTWSIPSGKE